MEQPQRKQNPLETEPIGRLIRRYSIPTALTLMVNYLYNIVDQIFVGQGVGVTGMAATNVAFPLTIVTIALALMIGDGCAANMSLCLGRRQQEEADRTASHTVTLLVAAGVFLAVAGSLFARQIVLLFGATETAFQASLDYTRIIVWGLPFLLFSSALTAIIRADGNPKYTMKCMILGAVINTVLDPVFIFGLHMGVVGAAIATVIGQVAAGGLCLVYLRRLQSVRIRRAWLRPTAALTGRIFKLGIPSFLTQIMTAAVQVTMNNLMTRYGGPDAYGGVALSVYGMVMKVYQIAHAMFVGCPRPPSPSTAIISAPNGMTGCGLPTVWRLPSRWWCPWAGSRSISPSPGPLAHCLSQGTRCTWTPASTSSGFTCWPFSSMGFTWPLPPFSRGLGDPCRLWPFPWSGRLWC